MPFSSSQTNNNDIETVLSLDEIVQHYPNQWVLIAYTELDEDLNVVRGEVLAHDSDYDRLYRQSLSREGKSVAIEYTGIVPDDLAVLL